MSTSPGKITCIHDICTKANVAQLQAFIEEIYINYCPRQLLQTFVRPIQSPNQ